MVLLSNKDVSEFHSIDLCADWNSAFLLQIGPTLLTIFPCFYSFHQQFLAQLILLIHNANSKTRPFSLTLKRCKYIYHTHTHSTHLSPSEHFVASKFGEFWKYSKICWLKTEVGWFNSVDSQRTNRLFAISVDCSKMNDSEQFSEANRLSTDWNVLRVLSRIPCRASSFSLRKAPNGHQIS